MFQTAHGLGFPAPGHVEHLTRDAGARAKRLRARMPKRTGRLLAASLSVLSILSGAAAGAASGHVSHHRSAANVRPSFASGRDATRSTLRLRREVRVALASIAGLPLSVRCSIPAKDEGMFEVLGHADWNRRLIELTPAVCRRDNALVTTAAAAYSKASYMQAQALLVAVHESVHLSAYSGHEDEALTECRAIQLVRQAALGIGVDDTTARALGHEAMRYDARLPGPGDWRVGLHEIPNYHSPDCYDGGPLDIHPASTDWPN
jgi:hypothetical protein